MAQLKPPIDSTQSAVADVLNHGGAALRAEIKAYQDYKALRDGAIYERNADFYREPEVGEDEKRQLNGEIAQFKTEVANAADLANNQRKFKAAYDTLTNAKKRGDELKARIDACVNQKRRVNDKLDAITNQPVVQVEYQRIATMQAQLQQMLDNRQFMEAEKMTLTIFWQIETVTAVVNRHKNHVSMRDKARASIQKLRAFDCAALQEDIDKLEKTLALAEDFARDRNYETAAPHIERVLESCGKLSETGAAYQRYAASLKSAEEAIAALTQDFPQSQAVQFQVEVLTSKVIDANKLAARLLFDDARNVTDAIVPGCNNGVTTPANLPTRKASSAKLRSVRQPASCRPRSARSRRLPTNSWLAI
jgi:hypothetical protein